MYAAFHPRLLQPTFEVLSIAVNSGLAAYPTAFTQVWSGAGGAIWRAVPPPGYVTAGDLFTTGGQEPELSSMVCLHGEWQQQGAVLREFALKVVEC